jgi:hypothetical protein
VAGELRNCGVANDNWLVEGASKPRRRRVQATTAISAGSTFAWVAIAVEQKPGGAKELEPNL